MAQSFTVGEYKTPCLDKKLDLGTHLLEGPISFSNMSELYQWLESQSLTAVFPTGEELSASKWLACGEIDISQATQGSSCIILNGESKAVSGFEDSEGVYPHTSIELPADCCAWVNACIPYQARRTVCEICIDGDPICIDGEPLEVVALEACC